MRTDWHPSPLERVFQQSSPFQATVWGVLGLLPIVRGRALIPPRPIGRWFLLNNHFPGWERFPGPPLWDTMFLGSPLIPPSIPPLFFIFFPS